MSSFSAIAVCLARKPSPSRDEGPLERELPPLPDANPEELLVQQPGKLEVSQFAIAKLFGHQPKKVAKEDVAEVDIEKQDETDDPSFNQEITLSA